MSEHLASRLERNIGLYTGFSISINSYFWIPIFFLYFREHVTLPQILQLEAIYYFSVIVLEVPSGYFSDAIGRKPTLIISALLFLTSYLLFYLGGSFASFAIAQMFLAGGFAFKSGTAASLHFDTLQALGRAEEFDAREARIARVIFGINSVTALVGGLLASINLAFAYLLSAMTSCVALLITMRFVEPPTPEEHAEIDFSIQNQMRMTLSYLRTPLLRWVFMFAVVMTVINHIPYEFYQPYLRILQIEMGILTDLTPAVAGFHAAIASIIAAYIAGKSIAIRDRIGLTMTLLTATTLQMLVIASMALLLHPLVVVFVLLRTAPRALSGTPMMAAIAPRVAKHHRATYLSLQSFAGRLSFSLTLVALSFFSAEGDTASWVEISKLLRISTFLAAAFLVVLVLTRKWAWEDDRSKDKVTN